MRHTVHWVAPNWAKPHFEIRNDARSRLDQLNGGCGAPPIFPLFSLAYEYLPYSWIIIMIRLTLCRAYYIVVYYRRKSGPSEKQKVKNATWRLCEPTCFLLNTGHVGWMGNGDEWGWILLVELTSSLNFSYRHTQSDAYEPTVQVAQVGSKILCAIAVHITWQVIITFLFLLVFAHDETGFWIFLCIIHSEFLISSISSLMRLDNASIPLWKPV